jgi:DNA-directed RNA polymerase subunit RPC12/RpoP
MGIVALTCPSCGSGNIHQLPNEDLPPLQVMTPYHCGSCHRTFESGPFQIPEKAQSDRKPPKVA